MLKRKAAIVTGSTSGIGLGIARALAAQDATIMLNGFGERKAIQALMEELRAQYGVEVDYSAADMSRPGPVTEMVAQCAVRFGAVDILVNNAGIQHTAPVEDFPVEKWEQILAINLSSAFYLHLSTDARSLNGVPSRVKFGSARWVKFESAPTRPR